MKKINKDTLSLIKALAVICVMAVTGISFVAYNYNSLVNEAKAYIDEISELSAGNVTKNIMSNAYTQESSVAYLKEKGTFNDASIIKMLGDELNFSGSNMVRVAYTDTSGRGFTVRPGGVVNRIDLSGTEYFKEAMKGKLFISETVTDRITRQPVNVYAMPVFNGERIIGVQTGVCLASELETSIGESYFDGEGHSYVVNKNIECVIDSNFSDEEDYNPFEKMGADDNTIEKIRSVVAQNPSGGAFKVKNDNNRYAWIVYRDLEINDWYLLLAVPYPYIVRNARNVLGISLLIMVLVIIGAIAVVKYFDMVKKENQRAVYKLAYLDEQSGLYNKDGFTLRAKNIIENSHRRYAVVFLDIDNFRSINGLFGYSAGNDILRTVGKALGEGLESNEVAARTGGDDFVMLVEYRSDDSIRKRLEVIGSKIEQSTFEADNTDYHIITYMGIYKLPKNPVGDEMEIYIDKAKLSVLTIQNVHKNAIAFYDEKLQKQLNFEAELENDMRQALKDGDFKVYVQPKYDANTRKLAGGEALIRWQHKTKGLLTPNFFVELFERNGMITDIDMYVYETVCKMQRKWLDEGYTPVPVSVNQSRLHLYRSDYIETLKGILKKYDLPAKYVELEITENIALHSGVLLEKMVKHIHDIGFTVSMDDFGSGESSLNILKDVDIDTLKLDRLFFLETENNTKARQIIKSVLDMAGQLNISTVAEGVENEEQLKFLQNAGCDLIQGYLFGKPMPYEEFEKLFKEQNENGNGGL